MIPSRYLHARRPQTKHFLGVGAIHLLPDSQSEAELIVLLNMIYLSRKEESDAHIELLL